MVKHASKAFALLDAEATQIAVPIYRVTTTTAKILAIAIFADQMHCVKLKIMPPNANVQSASKQIQFQNKVVFVCHQRAFQPADVRMDTCALEIFAKCHAQMKFHALLAKDAIIMFVQRFVIQITIACPEKFVMNAEHANPDVQRRLTVHQHKFAKAESVNVAMDSSEHHSAAQISMNVRSKFVIKAHFAKTHPDHLNAFVRNKLLEIHTHHLAAYYRINVFEMKIVRRIWLVSKVNVRNHAELPNADSMQFVNQANIKHSVNARRDIWAILLIKILAASVLNVLAAKNVV